MLHDRLSRAWVLFGLLLVVTCLSIGRLAWMPAEVARAAPLKQVVDTATPAPTDTDTPMPTDTYAPTATDTPSPTSSATPTLTPTNTMTSTPVAPSHLVISEFRTRGLNGAGDEFVEIFNPNGAAVNISGWKIKKSSGCGTSISTLVTITTGVVLQAGGHYLVAATGSSLTIAADQAFSPGIADEGGIALVMADGVSIVDQAGMCNSTQYLEGVNLAPLSGNSDQSYARNPSGPASGCYDVNNNASDFSLISPAVPQNKSSPLSMCPGVLTSTPTHTPTLTPTRTPTPTKTAAPGNIVINEFLPRPRSDWNGDGAVNVYDEYIEIMNVGTDAVSLKGWKLDDDLGGSSPYTLPDITLEPRAITRFFRTDTGIILGDGGDTVRLLKPGGQTADIYTYPVVEKADIAWCRLPDGNGAWTFACRPTPGRPNARSESGYLTPTPSSGREGQNAPAGCPLADSLAEGIIQSECGDSSAGIWNWGLWAEGGERWLENRFKWDVFIQ